MSGITGQDLIFMRKNLEDKRTEVQQVIETVTAQFHQLTGGIAIINEILEKGRQSVAGVPENDPNSKSDG